MKKYLKSELQREMREYLQAKHNLTPYTRVYAEIHGTPMYLTEAEVRYLQIKCKNEAAAGRFSEFVLAHKVWNGPRKRGGELMIWTEGGYFYNDFKSGFYDVNGNLAFELF